MPFAVFSGVFRRSVMWIIPSKFMTITPPKGALFHTFHYLKPSCLPLEIPFRAVLCRWAGTRGGSSGASDIRGGAANGAAKL